MPTSVALLLYLILIAVFLRFDPAGDPKISPALWVPLIWMFIAGSRLPSLWIMGRSDMMGGGALEDGNPLDRVVFLVLILLSVGILVSRSFRWGEFFTRNPMLVVFLAFALISAAWSDFPLVSVKRWFRDLGNYLVVLVVLTDPRPWKAISMLLRRLSFVLILLSILIIKYYPDMGRQYDAWTGLVAYSGVTTSKYMLAVICLVTGLYFFWDTVKCWPDRKKGRTWQVIFVNVLFLAMTLWVLDKANGATCEVCLLLGCVVIVAANSKFFKYHPAALKWIIPTLACLCLFFVFVVDLKAEIAKTVGRNPTFTDRTLVWAYLLKMKTNPWVGTGYETFWLGPRLEELWAAFAFRPNQAHNGFLEVYLNLGWIGVSIVVGFLIASYRAICKGFPGSARYASLGLALWAVLPILNITTAGYFKPDLYWLTFLMTGLAVPISIRRRPHNMPTGGGSLPKEIIDRHPRREDDLLPAYQPIVPRITSNQFFGGSHRTEDARPNAPRGHLL